MLGRILACALICALAGVLASACNRPKAYDMSSPEVTVTSFFAALNGKRFPAALEPFFANPTELRLWQMRCEVHGCVKGSFQIPSQKLLAYRAELHMRYQIQDDHGTIVTSPRETEVYLVRENDDWLLARIGERIPVTEPAAGGQGGSAGSRASQGRGAGDDATGGHADRDAEQMR